VELAQGMSKGSLGHLTTKTGEGKTAAVEAGLNKGNEDEEVEC